jgi:hypothetical protein
MQAQITTLWPSHPPSGDAGTEVLLKLQDLINQHSMFSLVRCQGRISLFVPSVFLRPRADKRFWVHVAQAIMFFSIGTDCISPVGKTCNCQPKERECPSVSQNSPLSAIGVLRQRFETLTLGTDGTAESRL